MTSGAVLSRKSSQVTNIRKTNICKRRISNNTLQNNVRCSLGRKAKNMLKKPTNCGTGSDLTYKASHRRNGRRP